MRTKVLLLPTGPSAWLRNLVDGLGIAFVAWFALHYATQRIYADAAYFLMHVADQGSFHVINGRWIIVLTQWLPVLGAQLGVSMAALITLFSLGNVVLLVLCYVFVSIRLRDRESGTALVAVQVVGLAHALFCPIFEFYYGALLLVVFRAVWKTDLLSPVVRWSLLSVLFVLVISSHFMGLVVMGLTLLLDRVWEQKRLAAWLCLLLVAQLIHRSLTLSAYEANAFGNVLLGVERAGVGWAFVPGRLWAKFLHTLFHYPDVLLFGLYTAVALMRRKDRWGLFVFILGALTIYTASTLYLADTTQSYYREIVDQPLAVWVILVLFARGTGPAPSRYAIPALVFLALTFRMVRTSEVAVAYVKRTAFIEERIATARANGIQRGLVLEGPVLQPSGHGVAPLPYMSPMEALLLSARQGPDSIVVLIPSKETHPTHAFTQRIDSSMAQFGMEFPTGIGPYFKMPTTEFEVLR